MADFPIDFEKDLSYPKGHPLRQWRTTDIIKLEEALNTLYGLTTGGVKGSLSPSDPDPGPENPCWYWGAGAGTYTNLLDGDENPLVATKDLVVLIFNGDYWELIESDVEYDISQLVTGWALVESFSIASPTYDANGYISGGNITWPDGDAGTISNVTVGTHGITSIRYNRTGGKYATVNITYDGSGNVTTTEVVLTGF